MAKARVEHVTEGTDSLGGHFSVTLNGEPIIIDYDETPEYLTGNITALTNITSEEIEVTRTGDCHFGCTWWINFAGETIDILIEEDVTQDLTYDDLAPFTLTIAIERNLSKNYVYVPISSDFLFTLETKPTV